ncbi:MAG TPA: protein kinase [Ktedonobacteraceae bacterium]|jgi:serine/threonine protein kinase|nr:protein kinase [Ktedonobacteraceae bacterium]
MSQDPLVGRKLGAYLVQSRLGEGGMASVYKAYHDRLRREVAIKVISAQIADQADFQLRFEREAQLIASLEHRNIVTVYDFGEDDDLTYLVMQFVGGGTLRERLQAGRPLDPRLSAQYALQMARALHHAHQRGIVHRDVKPQNMLISSSDANHLLLSDFGIAKLFDAVEDTLITGTQATLPSNPALTSADQMIGTAEYMAPEQINRQSVDARTDVYALGIVLYQMLAGYTPFRSTTVLGLLYQQVNTPARPIRELNPYAPEILAQIVAHAMEKSPAARFQSAEEMAQALEQALNLSTHPLPSTTLPQAGSASPATYVTHPAPTAHTPDISPQNSQTFRNTIPGTIHPLTTTRQKKTRSSFNLQNIVVSLLVIVTLLLFGLRVLPGLLQQRTSSGGGGPSAISSTAKVTLFDEKFADNRLVWLNGTDPTGHLTTSLQDNQYTMAVDATEATFFPYPDNVNPLPKTFRLTTRLTQLQGATNHYYGVTIYFKTDSQTTTAYVFAITSAGKYALLKYTGTSTPISVGPNGSSTAIKGLGKENTLLVTVTKNQIVCSVNGSIVGNVPAPTDPLFQGGRVSLFVTGPNATFVAKEVKLA